jgi:hypothetical protein
MPRRSKSGFALAVCLAAAACKLGDSTGVTIPANALSYVMGDSTTSRLIVYHFVDTASGANIRDTWLSDRGFGGFNCIGLLPNSPTDTTGKFLFAYVGDNVGEVEETISGTTDTVVKLFGPVQSMGTHGTYVVDSAGHLKLTWADGAQIQYFAPTAAIRLHGDTINSHAELSLLADSVHATWNVTWIRNTCPQ